MPPRNPSNRFALVTIPPVVPAMPAIMIAIRVVPISIVRAHGVVATVRLIIVRPISNYAAESRGHHQSEHRAQQNLFRIDLFHGSSPPSCNLRRTKPVILNTAFAVTS